MRRMVLVLVLLCSGSAARGQDISATLALDSTRLLIGHWTRAVLTVDAPAGTRLRMPLRDADLANADVVEAGDADSAVENGRLRYTQEYTLTSFDTGSVQVAAIVPYRLPGDTTTFAAMTRPVSLTVLTVPVDTAKSFRDIADVMGASPGLLFYLLLALIAAAVAAAVWYGYRRFLRQPVTLDPVLGTPPPSAPVDLYALQRLSTLEARHLWEAGRDKQFQSELTDILREYIERGFSVPALEQTSSEILAGVALHGFPPDVLASLREVFRVADMTKFATYAPAPSEHGTAQVIARNTVERTRELLPVEVRETHGAVGVTPPVTPGTTATGENAAGEERGDV